MGLPLLSTRAVPGVTSSSPPETERTPRVALVAREGSPAMELKRELAEQGWEVVPLSGPERLFAVLGDLGADLVLLDTDTSDRAPTELCGDIRATEAGRFLPIVILNMAPVSDDLICQGLMAGADDYCLPAARPLEFIARVRVQLRNKRIRDRLRRVRNERDHYKRASKVDALTGLLNRGSFDSLLSEAMTGEKKFSILFIDVDHFKSINDRFGHDVGDDVLRKVSRRIENAARGNDRCGRYGGEEFVVLVAGADEQIAAAVAERHRGNIETLEIPSLGQKLTVSVGYAVFDPEHPDLSREALYKRADSALYRAKRGGRNRVERAFGADEVSNVFELPAPLSRMPAADSKNGSQAPATQESIAVPAMPSPLLPSIQSSRPSPTSPTIVATTPRKAKGVAAPSEIESALLKAMSTKRAGLPLLPDAAAQALRLARDPQSDMPRIARLVDRDPTLAARFLSLANSPLYSAGSRVVSTHGALVRLGLATARDLLLQVVYERAHGGGGRFHQEVSAVFSKSVMAAIATSEISRSVGVIFEDAYLCGLLHDIGEARILRVLGELECELDEEDVASLVARHHARAGAEVARAWGLTGAVIEACEAHHDSPREVSERIKIVMMGDVIAETASKPRKRGEPLAIGFSEWQTERLQTLGLDLKVATSTLQGVFIAGRMVVG